MLGAARGAKRTRAAAVRDRLPRPYPMPDHDGRPPRARERADTTAPARKRASRDAERVESHDENEAEASRDEPVSCSPTWSVVSLSELTSRASSPSDVSCSSVVAAAALAAREDEEEGDPFPNGPPSPRETNVKKRPVDGSLDASGETDAVRERTTSSRKKEPPPRKSLCSPAEPFPPLSAAETARRLVACLRAATAARLHALARALEAEGEPQPRAGRPEPNATARGDAVQQSDFFLAEALAQALARLERFSRRALAALDASARTCASTTRRLVADARESFRALADAFEERLFFASREETSKREKKTEPDRARHFLVAAAVALAPLAPAALWCAFSGAYSKRA